MEVIDAVGYRDLIEAVDRLYLVLGYIYNIHYNCYYGFRKFFNQENLENLWLELDVVKNILFNLGYMYTDITMIVIGVPGYTETDYMYYIMFYISDFLFRFLFRPDAAPLNCWYPWNYVTCSGDSY